MYVQMRKTPPPHYEGVLVGLGDYKLHNYSILIQIWLFIWLCELVRTLLKGLTKPSHIILTHLVLGKIL